MFTKRVCVSAGREGLFIAISQGKDLILDPLKSILGGHINEVRWKTRRPPSLAPSCC